MELLAGAGAVGEPLYRELWTPEAADPWITGVAALDGQ